MCHVTKVFSVTYPQFKNEIAKMSGLLQLLQFVHELQTHLPLLRQTSCCTTHPVHQHWLDS